jgi:gliding motility-associated-like protein
LLLSIKNKVVDSLKKQALFVCFFISFNSLLSQNNLVINGGFDSLVSCPVYYSLIDTAYNWFQPIRQFSSSDLFSPCSISSMTSSPINDVGHQNALSNTAYSGIAFFLDLPTHYNEYIEARLVEPLKEGYTYCGEFYVSLADTSNFAISSIGLYFSKDSVRINSSDGYLIQKNPQIQNDSLNIISNKVGWTKISGNFVAEGGEEFITIGNFFNNTITKRHYIKVSNYVDIPPNNYTSNMAYYYIDNVSVYACDSPLVEDPKDTSFVFIPNVFSPNQDGENDLWEVTASKVSSLNIQVFNRWGEQVYKTSLINTEEPTNFKPAWDGYTLTGKTIPEGTYFYIVQYTLPSGETKVEKGHLNLLR